MWYVAKERRDALLREAAEDRLVRSLKRRSDRHDGNGVANLAGRLAGLLWRSAHAGLWRPTFVRSAEQRFDVGRGQR